MNHSPSRYPSRPPKIKEVPGPWPGYMSCTLMLLGASVRTNLLFNSCTPRIRDPELKPNQPIPQIMHAPAGNTPSMMQMHARARLRHSVQHVPEMYRVRSTVIPKSTPASRLAARPTSTLHKLALRHWLRMEQKGAGGFVFHSGEPIEGCISYGAEQD